MRTARLSGLQFWEAGEEGFARGGGRVGPGVGGGAEQRVGVWKGS